MPYTISDDNDSKTKVHRFDDAHNFRVDHFSIRGHLDYLLGTSSVSLGSELIHSDIRVFRPTGPFHSDVKSFTRNTIFHSDDYNFTRKTIFHSDDYISLGRQYLTRTSSFHSDGNLFTRNNFTRMIISLGLYFHSEANLLLDR